MESIWKWGVDVIINLQASDGLRTKIVFQYITFMGDEEFYLLLIPLLLWCIDFKKGARLTIFFLLSAYITFFLKDFFQHPRPFNLVPSVHLASAEGYGFPSGHALSAITVWGAIAIWARKVWVWAVTGGIVILIGFSRIYLGVHFPTDVLAGWLIGISLLILYVFIHPGIEVMLRECSFFRQILLALLGPIALFVLHSTKDTSSVTGTLAGVGIGLTIAGKYALCDISERWWQRALNYLVGIAITAVIYLGLKTLLPGEGSPFYLHGRFLRYALLGLWLCMAPWTFRQYKRFHSST